MPPKYREINFHELEKKREIRENLVTRKFPSIQYILVSGHTHLIASPLPATPNYQTDN